MRLPILIILLLLSLSTAFGQFNVELYFKSACNDSIYKSEYSLYDKEIEGNYINSTDNKVTVPKASTYYIHVSIVQDDYVHSFDHDLVINENLVDTLLIPRITFTTRDELHSNFWSYFNCQLECKGKEIDFYKNENKRIEGEFVNGKPKWMVEYRIDGTKEYEYWYEPGNFFHSRLNRYNEHGELYEYEIKEFKKRKSITLVYDSMEVLIDRIVQKY